MRMFLSFCTLVIISAASFGGECTNSQVMSYNHGFAFVEVAKRQVNDGSRFIGTALQTAEGISGFPDLEISKEDISEWVKACIAAAKAHVAFSAAAHYFESAVKQFEEAKECSNSKESSELSEQNANLAEESSEEIDSLFRSWCFDMSSNPYDLDPAGSIYHDQFTKYDYRNFLESSGKY